MALPEAFSRKMTSMRSARSAAIWRSRFCPYSTRARSQSSAFFPLQFAPDLLATRTSGVSLLLAMANKVRLSQQKRGLELQLYVELTVAKP